MSDAPGWPGIPPRWSSSDKTGLGTALSALSPVWFTLSHGILNEVYYPRVDQACIRDFGLIITDGETFFAEEKRDTDSEVATLADGVPAYVLRNTHRPATGGQPRFIVHKHIITDPGREVVLQKVRLEDLASASGTKGLRLHALLAPHLVNGGANNTGWLGDYKGQPMLFAEGSGTALALAASAPWVGRSVGFAGVSDGWQDLNQHRRMTWQYERAVDGNVALTGEVRLAADGPLAHAVVFALGFGRSWAEAAFRARASLQDDFDALADAYAEAWRGFQAPLRALDRVTNGHNTYRISTAVIRAHDSPSFPGGLIASLSIPWGGSKGDDDLGGYHLVWPRDLVETAGGMLAADATVAARRVLDYLRATQEPDGHWPQNTWLDGMPYWQGVQMDECAFPILLVDLAWRMKALDRRALETFWPMVRLAVGFVVRNGPVTGQDRWEENSGFSPFTLAVEIAALLAAGELADLHGDAALATFARETADAWNDAIESWTFAGETELGRLVGVDGYYVRLAPDGAPHAESDLDRPVFIKNRPEGQGEMPAHAVVSPDALALVRFGLRAADDPRIVQTVKVIDHLLKVDLPAGPCWRRYNGDGYGEHENGDPFDGTGLGRLWPLLTGERAHYAIAAGQFAEAAQLLETMEVCASRGFMLPEQVWDTTDLPDRELFLGRPSGSAMPLVWAHAEHVKLLRSLADKAVFDMPPQPVRRYQVDKVRARVQPWRPGFQPATAVTGRVVRVELPAASVVRWTIDEWASTEEAPTVDTGLGVHAMEVPCDRLAPGQGVVFTWRDVASGGWHGTDYEVRIVAAGNPPPTPSPREGEASHAG